MGGDDSQSFIDALRPSYDDLVLRWSEGGRAGLMARRNGQPLHLWVCRARLNVAEDPTERIPEFFDGTARARHPALAPIVGARFFRAESLVVVEQEAIEPATEPSSETQSELDSMIAAAEALAYAHEHGWAHGAFSAHCIVRGPPVQVYGLGAEWLAGRKPTSSKDIVDFVALLEASDSDSVRRWLSSTAVARLRDRRTSMRQVADSLAQLLETAAPPANPTDPQTISPGYWIDHFRVVKPIGRGGMADVFLARDTVLGRSVALKLLRPDVIDAADTSRLLSEARSMASFSHPNIVVLYGVGRHEGRIYLVLEYLPGGSLADHMTKPMPPAEALRIGIAVGKGLQEAHRHGLLHCDLKPANVLVPKDGRPRVVDFGLARAMSSANASPGRSWSGTPAYMSPEQWEGEELTAAADVWAVGMMLFEMLEGYLPQIGDRKLPLALADANAPPVQSPVVRLNRLVADCLRRVPRERPSIDDVVRILEEIQADEATVDPGGARPFRGLQAFETEHARFFSGREDEAAQFVAELSRHPCLAVVGPSGAGKSSFVQAAVIPQLLSTGRWRIVRVRPGPEPLDALAAQLQALSPDPGSDRESGRALAQRIRATPKLVNLKLHDLASIADSNVLLFVDQLEEVLTNPKDPDDIQIFLSALASAFDGREDTVRVVTTLRSDFVGRLADYDAATHLLDRLVVLRPPDRKMLLRCVTAPLNAVGFKLSPPELADRIVDDTVGSSSQLPLLQFACALLWETGDEKTRTLSEANYEAIGGVQGALAQHADHVIAALHPAEVATARSILLRLVGAEGARRIVSYHALTEGVDSRARVLARLIEGRLVSTHATINDKGEDEANYELVHEALVRSWQKLARWIDETREERVLREELEEVVRPWVRRGERADETWQGTTLHVMLERINALDVELSDDMRRFLDVSKRRDEEQRRRERFRVTAAFAFLSIVAIALGAAALAFWRQADNINRAAANQGRFTLVIHAFDIARDSGAPRPVSLDDLPDLNFHLLDVSRDDPTAPGDRIDSRLITATRELSALGALRSTIEVRGGPAFVAVTGRGRAGRRCMPSILPIRRLPGFSERNDGVVIELWAPTCQATEVGMTLVPAGPYISGGAGEPRTKFDEYIQPEEIVELPAYYIDIHEVSNSAMRRFSRMSSHTGLRQLKRPVGDDARLYESMGLADHPAVGTDGVLAQAYCRFMGKRLPTANEWEKAARGGLELRPGVPNPMPRRSFPWGTPQTPQPANLFDNHDGFPGTAPVTAFADGASPYGVLNMAGNADEWTSTPRPNEPDRRIVKGGSWGSPMKLEHSFIAYDNHRDVVLKSLYAGVRCAQSAADDNPRGIEAGVNRSRTSTRTDTSLASGFN